MLYQPSFPTYNIIDVSHDNLVWVTQRSAWLPSGHLLCKVCAEAEETFEHLLCSRWSTSWGWKNNWALTVFSVRYDLSSWMQYCLTLNMKELWSSETPVANYHSIRPKVSRELASSVGRNSPLLCIIKTVINFITKELYSLQGCKNTM
jgi:hypothetical protein